MEKKKSNKGQISLSTIILFFIIVLGGCTQPNNNTEDPSVMIISFDGTIANFTVSELTEMDSISETSSFENSLGNIGGKGLYTGANISTILDFYGIDFLSTDLLIARASDGYEAIYSYENIYPNSTFYNLQGSMVLAYSFNGTKAPHWEKGPQIVFLPQDGQYSNTDKALTSSLEVIGSAGSRWISNVVSLEIKRENDTITFLHTNNHTLSYSQLLFLPKLSGTGSYLKTTGAIEGPFDLEGVDIVKTLELLFNTSEDFSIEVVATDGYKMTYTKDQVFGKVPMFNSDGVPSGYGAYEVNLSLVLAYNENGNPLDHGGPFRMVYLGDEAITDGHFWTKYVKTIKIIPGIPEWSISLSGLTETNLGLDEFDSLVYCNDKVHTLNYTYVDADEGVILYEGFPLWIALSMVDGGLNEAGHYLFNDDLAQLGYQVQITDFEGTNHIFESTQVARNDSFILTHVKNGMRLPEEEFPVRLLIDGLSENYWVNRVASITLINIPG